MVIRLAFVVPHVPTEARRRLLVDLRKQLRDLVVVSDSERRGPWPPTREGLLSVYRRGRATHVTVLNDDLVLCEGFAGHLLAAVAARPEHAIQPFTMSKRQREAHERGDAWFTSRDLLAAGATFPVAWVGEMVREIDESFPLPDYASSDVRMAWWLLRRDLGPVWHTVPSLVEHGLSSDSTMRGHSRAGRVASVFTPDPSPSFAEIPLRPVHYSGRARTRGIE